MKEEYINLPSPDTSGSMSVEKAISKRRSVRSFSNKNLTLKQISQLLWSAQGITNERGFRAAPSAGALYPLELYVLNEDGVYTFISEGHKLRKISNNDLRLKLQAAALHQTAIGSAAIDIVICAVYERVTSTYGERGIRYTDMEAGHAAQNIHLQAVASGLSSVPVGAFNDSAVSDLLGLAGEETPLYIIPVGYKY